MENRLKELREKNNLSLNKLRTILKENYNFNVSSSQLMYYESGERSPRNKKIWEHLADYFMVSEAYLLKYSDYKNDIEEIVSIKGKDLQNGMIVISQEDLNQFSFKKNFIKFLTAYHFALSNDDIDKVIDLLNSLNDTNKKILNNFVTDGDIEKLEELKDGDFSNLFTYSSTWSNKYNSLKNTDN